LAIRNLSRYRKSCCKVPGKVFEKTHSNKNIYSIRFKLQINIRILFSFKDDKVAMLLCGFIENNDSDYKRSIDKAYRRFKQCFDK
jgi:hypothetical protein